MDAPYNAFLIINYLFFKATLWIVRNHIVLKVNRTQQFFSHRLRVSGQGSNPS